MKTYLPTELEPGLYNEVKNAYDLVVPAIQDHVMQTLGGQPYGSVAVHATYLKIINDVTNEILYTEMETQFMKIPGHLVAALSQVSFFDTFEDYEKARKETAKEATRHYGNEMFPTTKHFRK